MSNKRIYPKKKNEDALNFRTDSISEIMETSGLNRILNEVEEINFAKVYYSDNPDMIKEIENLERCLRSEGLEKHYKEIRAKLKSMEPDDESKVIIVVLSLLRTLEEQNLRLAYFEDGIYRIYTPELKYWKKLSDHIISHFLCEVAERSGFKRSDALKKRIREMLVDHFKEHAYSPIPKKSIDSVSINLQNGTYVISNEFTGLREHRPTDYHFNILPFSYVEGATCPMFMKFIETSLPEKEAINALAEISAYPLYPQLKLEIAGVLQGPGRTGKSTFQAILISLYGKENVGSFTLTSLCSPAASSNYNRALLTDYLLNYSSEMGGQGCDPNMVKKVISREQVEARFPYGKPFMISEYCPIMFNVNDLPLLENTSALWRRLKFFPFYVVVPPEQVDIEFANKIILTELPGVFNWLLEGLKRLMTNKRITESKLCQSIKDALRRDNDPVASFIAEYGYKSSSDQYEHSVSLFKEFQQFCEECNLKSRQMSRTTFLRRLEENGIKVDRKAPNHQYRVYCEKIESKTKNNDNDITKMFGLSDSDE